MFNITVILCIATIGRIKVMLILQINYYYFIDRAFQWDTGQHADSDRKTRRFALPRRGESPWSVLFIVHEEKKRTLSHLFCCALQVYNMYSSAAFAMKTTLFGPKEGANCRVFLSEDSHDETEPIDFLQLGIGI